MHIAVPAKLPSKIKKKQNEQRDKYVDFATELTLHKKKKKKKEWNNKVTMISNVNSALGTIPQMDW